MKEEWKPVVGYEDTYEVSSLGNVKRIKSGRGSVVGRILKPYLNNHVGGYYYVTLTKDCIQKDFFLHRLVASAFFGESSLTVNHKNGIKTDNRVENLEYMTNQENLLHATKVLKKRSGESHWNSKLSEKDVRLIVSLKNSGLSHEQIAKAFSISRPTVTEIMLGRKWKVLNN